MQKLQLEMNIGKTYNINNDGYNSPSMPMFRALNDNLLGALL